jgi:hypothetical protein
MLELNSELREIYLDPGELHIAREPAIIRTALGAYSITFWSPKLRVGGAVPSVVAVLPHGLDRRKAPGHGMPMRGFLDSATCLAV